MAITAAPLPAFADSKCGRCIALCCRYFSLEIDEPDEVKDFEDLKWYLLHERVHIFVDDDAWYLQVFSKCHWLGDDHKCQNYDERPSICREYSDELCDRDGPESDKLFRTVDELWAYRDAWIAEQAEEKKRKRREAARRRARKKAKATGKKAGKKKTALAAAKKTPKSRSKTKASKKASKKAIKKTVKKTKAAKKAPKAKALVAG